MYDFFKDIALEDEEKLPEKRVDSIKSAVLSRIKEENSMKKISAFKTFSIAAIVAATAAMSAMLASAEKPATLPIKQSDAKTECHIQAAYYNDDKQSDAETECYVQAYYNDGKLIDTEPSNVTKIVCYIVDNNEVSIKFDSAEAARDYLTILFVDE